MTSPPQDRGGRPEGDSSTAARWRQIALLGGVGIFVLLLALPVPEGMPASAWRMLALVVLLAVCWPACSWCPWRWDKAQRQG